MTTKERIHALLNATGDDRAGRAVSFFILSLVTLNIVALVIETVEPVYRAAPWAFDAFETVSVVIFSVEYVLRLWSCTTVPRFQRPLLGRLRYAFTALALADLLAVLPFYLPFIGVDLRVTRALRLFRLFRLGKIGRYSRTLQTMKRVVRSRKEALVLSMSFVVILMLFASVLMYYTEHEAQPRVFASIPDAMWWAVATLSTVGYGDAVPVTPLGKVLSGVVAVLGIGLFAIPTGVLAGAFINEFESGKEEPRCPHCGRAPSEPTKSRSSPSGAP
jgi:voltage-gated potassium channel